MELIAAQIRIGSVVLATRTGSDQVQVVRRRVGGRGRVASTVVWQEEVRRVMRRRLMEVIALLLMTVTTATTTVIITRGMNVQITRVGRIVGVIDERWLMKIGGR